MKLPYLPETKSKTKQQTVAFAGINYSQNTRDGELAECENLSSRNFPCLSQRAGRKTVQTYTSPTAMFVKRHARYYGSQMLDVVVVVDGTTLYVDGKAVGTVKAGEKQFASINSKIVIWPDRICYDIQKKKLENLDADLLLYNVTFTKDAMVWPVESYIATISSNGGDTYVDGNTSIMVYKSATVNKASGSLTMVGGTTKKVSALTIGDYLQYEGTGDIDKTKVYQKVTSVLVEDDGTYSFEYDEYEVIHYTAPSAGMFHEGDAVEIQTDIPGNSGTYVVRKVLYSSLEFDPNTFQTTGEDTGPYGVAVSRSVPRLEYICESNNRIWGAVGNTIYASALGDPFNFNVFEGLSTDSFAVAVGSDGEFTGCIGYGGAVLFFKENCVHKVLGSYPAQYEVYTYQIPGVKKGSEKSLKIINEVLYYKGVNGVYRYTGGTPELITDNFGLRRFSDGVAGTDGQNYYLSVLDEKNAWQLYVYDTLRGIWLREDSTQAIDFALLDGNLVYLDGGSKKLMKLGQDDTEEGRVAWSAEFCKMDETTLGRKGYSKILLRADLDAGAWIRVEISQDDGLFRQIYTGHNEKAKTLVLAILPGRCDNFRIRLSGKGRCMVKSMVREFSVGSEY